MNIKILCVGRIKEPYLKKGIDYYKSVISKQCHLEIVEVEDEKTPDGASEKMESQIRKIEGERLMRYISDNAIVYALCIEGKKLTTSSLRDSISRYKLAGEEEIMFVIGGSLGLDPAIVRRANEKISFSNMTFPHQMMRMILLEQLGRVIE